MRKAMRMAWSGFVTVLFATVIFFVLIQPAKAPKGNKRSLGGRTIASIQEEEFDRVLQQYQECYGVRFVAATATPERRRVCKAVLVHQLSQALGESGTYFVAPVEFRCENTAMGRRSWYNEMNHAVAALQPNTELATIDAILKEQLDRRQVSMDVDARARDACAFISSCKRALSFERFSLRKIGTCFTDNNALHRRMMVDTVGEFVFPRSREKLLIADLLHELQ